MGVSSPDSTSRWGAVPVLDVASELVAKWKSFGIKTDHLVGGNVAASVKPKNPLQHFTRFTQHQINLFLAEQPRDDGTVLRQAAVAIAVAGNFASIADAQQVQMEKVVRNKAAGDIWISMPNGSVIYVKAMTDSAICPVAKISAYLDLLSEKGLTFSRGPIFGPMHADDFSLISQYVAKAVGLAGPKAASYDHRSFQLTPLPESASAPDHDYSTINTTAPASTALDDRIKVEVIPEVLIREEDVGDWPVCGEEEIVCTDPGPPLIKVEPHPDENQVISFLDSLIAAKASNPNQASGGDSSNSSSCSNSNGGSPSGPSISKEVGSVAGSVSQDRIVPKVEPGVPGVVNGIKRIPSTGGSGGGASVVVISSHHHGNRGTHNGATASKVQAAVTPQNSTSGCVKAKFVDGEFSQSYEQTDCRINEVVGMELQMASDPTIKNLNGWVNIYLVHSHELFLRDIIDAKGHQGVKDDTDEMRDFPLRAWVANGNGSEKYNILPTKQHGDVKAVTVTLQGENKINLLFTVLSTDQRNFGRNHKAKLWSLEIVGEVNNNPVKISIPVQVVACLRNPRKLKRSKRRLDGFNRAVKHFKEDSDAQTPTNGSSSVGVVPTPPLPLGAAGPLTPTAGLFRTQNGSGLIPLPPPPASVMNGTLSSGAATSGSALATAIASIESRSVSEDSRDDEGDTMIEEILRHQAEYLEKLPRHLLPYELARARALNTMKLPRD